MHGLAINVDMKSLQNFNGIVPCGIEGREVTCINREIEADFTIKDFSIYVQEALEQTFGITLVAAPFIDNDNPQ